MLIEELYEIFKSSKGVCTDSRKLKKDQIFFTLKGPNFDGNRFAAQALKKGALHVVVDDFSMDTLSRITVVDDALQCLQELAAHHRKVLGVKILSLTGSNGKTTTKELLAAVLAKKFKTYATKGNLNNHIGIPLSLLEIEQSHEIAVIEMGANHAGEIESYCEYTDPNIGLITNIGSAHLEGFGSIEGVLNAKSELFTYLEELERTIFLNADDELLFRKWNNYSHVINYGKSKNNEFSGSILHKAPLVGIEWTAKETGEIKSCMSKLTGAYNFSNLLAAVSVGTHFGVEASQIRDAIENYSPDNLRSQILKTGNNTVVLDAYNANPSSMKLALDNMKTSFGEKLVFVLGDMNELGDESAVHHEKILKTALALTPDQILLVGKNFKPTNNESVIYFADTAALKKHFSKNQLKGYNILVKGSRTIGLEKILELL